MGRHKLAKLRGIENTKLFFWHLLIHIQVPSHSYRFFNITRKEAVLLSNSDTLEIYLFLNSKDFLICIYYPGISWENNSACLLQRSTLFLKYGTKHSSSQFTIDYVSNFKWIRVFPQFIFLWELRMIFYLEKLINYFIFLKFFEFS